MNLLLVDEPNQNTDLNVILCKKGAELHDSVKAIAELMGFEATLGETCNVALPEDNQRVLLVGLGEQLDVADVPKIASPILSASKLKNVNSIAVNATALDDMAASTNKLVASLTKHLVELAYMYTETKDSDVEFAEDLAICIGDSERFAVDFDHGQCIGAGMNTMKHLGDLPSNICTPGYLADYAETLFDEDEVTVIAYDEEYLEEIQAGAFLSVTAGSDNEARMISMSYNNAPEGTKPIVLVGKAVTFDSGGISLKPSNRMEEMKYDMCGGASVIGTIQAIAAMKLPVHVIGLVGATENMPGPLATKPGDVVTSLSGKTIEVVNTDAEGRMVLCDMLTYAGKHYDPEVVIDIATLTGACCVALGDHATGVFSSSDELASEILTAGISVHDRGWQLPIWDEYNKQMDSKFADVTNSGKPGAGASTAACFLNRFASEFDYKWAHLDIAGTAWTSTATGRPVPMLVEFIKQHNK